MSAAARTASLYPRPVNDWTFCFCLYYTNTLPYIIQYVACYFYIFRTDLTNRFTVTTRNSATVCLRRTFYVYTTTCLPQTRDAAYSLDGMRKMLCVFVSYEAVSLAIAIIIRSCVYAHADTVRFVGFHACAAFSSRICLVFTTPPLFGAL